MFSPAFLCSPCSNMTRSPGSWSNNFAALAFLSLLILIDGILLDLRVWSMTAAVSKRLTVNDSELTVKRICPGTEHDALGIRLVFLKVQQMADQHLDLRPVTSKALHFANVVEEIHADVVILEDTSGLQSFFVKLRIPSGSRVTLGARGYITSGYIVI